MLKSAKLRFYSLLIFLPLSAAGCSSVDPNRLSLTVIDQHSTPILTKSSPGNGHNKYGFEGGRVVKVDGRYHLFISEMTGDPKWAKTMLAHWLSADGYSFERRSTLYESSGDFTGADPRAALFLPMPIFDEREGRWNLFHSAFKAAPNSGGRWLLNHEGRIHRAVSATPGRGGIGGPYEDVGVVLQPGTESDAWEGLQGTDSFFPFRARDGKWLAFYGSAHTQRWPTDFWAVGLVEAESLGGPWRRLSELNPVFKPRSENPHVHRLPSGIYLAVFDLIIEKGREARRVGYAFSRDGRTWTEPRHIELSGGQGEWIQQVRTPISIIPMGDERFLIYFTAVGRDRYSQVGRVVVRLSPDADGGASAGVEPAK